MQSEKGLRHAWLWLTKRPRRMAEFALWLREQHGIAWPDNLWAGTSITSTATLGRVRDLENVGASVAFLSVEPQWEAISIAESLRGCPSVRWVINGGESDQGEARAHEFKVEWARSLRDECRKAGVSLFVKQLGSRVTEGGAAVPLRDGHGGEWDEWPEDLRIRELPSEAYCSSVGAEWTPAVVADWIRVAAPQAREAVRALADAAGAVSTAQANAAAGASSGGPILGGLLAWATRRGLRPPLSRVPLDGKAAYTFSSRGLRAQFREQLARA